MEEEAMRATINAYRNLSGEMGNHCVLIKDKTMIQFMAYSLTSVDIEVVQLSLDTLENLIKNEMNKPILQSVFGVTEAIKASSEREDLSDSMRQQSEKLYNLLLESTPTYVTSTPQRVAPLNRNQLTTHIATFQVQGLFSETRQELESVVVNIRGVVSVVVDVDSQRCVVRALHDITPQMIANVIAAKTDMIPRLVLRNKNNQEYLKNILENVDESSASLPPYLEEDYEEPVRDSAILSLQSLKTNASSWYNAATSFLHNSFYW